jgi:hypothetical protein
VLVQKILSENINLEINEICKPFKIQAFFKSRAFLECCYFSCLNWIRDGCGKIEKDIIFIHSLRIILEMKRKHYFEGIFI